LTEKGPFWPMDEERGGGKGLPNFQGKKEGKNAVHRKKRGWEHRRSTAKKKKGGGKKESPGPGDAGRGGDRTFSPSPRKEKKERGGGKK